MTVLNQWLTGSLRQAAQISSSRAEHFAGQIRTDPEAAAALGMRPAALARWGLRREEARAAHLLAADRNTVFGTITKILRLFLQSAMLALGAWLVLQGSLSPGVMIAASILLGRALAPIEMAIPQWQLAQSARVGWQRLGLLLAAAPAQAPPLPLPAPASRLELRAVTVFSPGGTAPVLQQLGFEVTGGQALGVIGPSGSGKSCLARTVIGAWPAAHGSLHLGGARLDRYAPEDLGRHIGYLPQRVTLFEGTVAENIARLTLQPEPSAVLDAARKAGAHEMILDLPQGYDTRLTGTAETLSGGQIQRIGLARALFGDPAMVVLDEPDSNLDNDGALAVNAAIRALKQAGRLVLVMAHRPAAIAECTQLLVLDSGRMRAFGPRDEILRETVRNTTAILRSSAPGGVA